jgi:CO/xanthine dehydrogenase Mo-binding subunit
MSVGHHHGVRLCADAFYFGRRPGDRPVGFQVSDSGSCQVRFPYSYSSHDSPTKTLPVATFPYSTQIREVEVDPDTSAVEIARYAAVDDVARAINPLILHGQTHGGIAQGVLSRHF